LSGRFRNDLAEAVISLLLVEWDSRHGEWEMYNKRGKNQGVLDPNTGQPVPEKGPDPTRSVEP